VSTRGTFDAAPAASHDFRVDPAVVIRFLAVAAKGRDDFETD